MLSCFIKTEHHPGYLSFLKSKANKEVYSTYKQKVNQNSVSRHFFHCLQNKFQQHFSVICLTSVWQIRYNSILINAAINQVTACVSLALYMCQQQAYS